jgi:outer membrane protein assembly factor BamB
MLGTPTATTDRVYLGRGVQDTGDTHDLLAVDARTGAVVWSFASPAGKQVQMGGLAGSTAFADSEDNSVYALDAATGAVRWTHATDGPIGSLAAIVGDTVYVSSGDRTVRALATDTGAQQWQVSVVGSPTTPAVIDGYVIVGTDLGRVVAIAGSGSP